MNTEQLIDSFVEILQCVSLEDTLVSSNDPLKVVISSQYVDSLDFELAVSCFEATHRVLLQYSELTEDELGEMTIASLITHHLVTNDRELLDPLFVTKQFCWFRNALFELTNSSDEE